MQVAFRQWCNIIFDNIYVSLFFRHLNIYKKQLWEIFPKAVFLWILLVNNTLFRIFAERDYYFVFLIADRLAFLRDCFANI